MQIIPAPQVLPQPGGEMNQMFLQMMLQDMLAQKQYEQQQQQQNQASAEVQGLIGKYPNMQNIPPGEIARLSSQAQEMFGKVRQNMPEPKKPDLVKLEGVTKEGKAYIDYVEKNKYRQRMQELQQEGVRFAKRVKVDVTDERPGKRPKVYKMTPKEAEKYVAKHPSAFIGTLGQGEDLATYEEKQRIQAKYRAKSPSYDIGKINTINKGEEVITREMTADGWKEIARAPRWKAPNEMTQKDYLEDLEQINTRIASIEAGVDIAADVMQPDIDKALDRLKKAKLYYAQALRGDYGPRELGKKLAEIDAEMPQVQETIQGTSPPNEQLTSPAPQETGEQPKPAGTGGESLESVFKDFEPGIYDYKGKRYRWDGENIEEEK